MLKVVSFVICPFVQRVTALLEAKQLAYEVEYISLNNKPEWFLEASPHGQVPIVITENGTTLFESDAIIEYIEEVTTPLKANVSAEQRALDRAWSYLATKHYLSQCGTMASGDRESFNQKAAKLMAVFAKAEAQLETGPFFSGEQLNQVDIAWYPLLHRADIIAKYTGVDFIAAYPKVKAWQRHLLGMKTLQRSVSADFETRFKAFYLSDKTYLGRLYQANKAEISH